MKNLLDLNLISYFYRENKLKEVISKTLKCESTNFIKLVCSKDMRSIKFQAELDFGKEEKKIVEIKGKILDNTVIFKNNHNDNAIVYFLNTEELVY